MVNDQTSQIKVCFRDLLSDFCLQQDYDTCENLFRDLLKAAIGEDKLSGTHSPLETANTLYTLNTIQVFVRRIDAYLNKEAEILEPELKPIMDLYRTINYDDLQQDIFRAFNLWIFDDDTEQLACLAYIHKMACDFKNAADLLSACYKLNIVYSATNEKRGQSC